MTDSPSRVRVPPSMRPSTAPATTGIRVADFGGLQIAYDERVLEPRPWTTAQSYWAAEILPGLPEGPVLELCAGAGQIGLLAVVDSDRPLVCVELDNVAAAYAAGNALGAGMDGRVEIREGNLRHALDRDESFPLILADPPWVSSHQVDRFPADPRTAIDGGLDGLDVARDCLAVIQSHLAPGGAALLQLGSAEQCEVVEGLVAGRLVPGGRRVHPGQGALLRLDRATD